MAVMLGTVTEVGVVDSFYRVGIDEDEGLPVAAVWLASDPLGAEVGSRVSVDVREGTAVVLGVVVDGPSLVDPDAT